MPSSLTPLIPRLSLSALALAAAVTFIAPTASADAAMIRTTAITTDDGVSVTLVAKNNRKAKRKATAKRKAVKKSTKAKRKVARKKRIVRKAPVRRAPAARFRHEFAGGSFTLQFGHGPRYDRPRFRNHRVCKPRRALRKAQRRGLRHAHIRRINRRGVVVAGRKWGKRVVMGFANHRSCPVRFVRSRPIWR